MSDLEHKAIERLKMASEMSLRLYHEPLIITDSGGKDSAVCKALAARAGIPYEVMHNHTTADAPETVYFVRDEAKRLEADGVKYTINYPTYKGERTSMWKLIPKMLMPPTLFSRYCCAILKETSGKGRFITTGVRWEESKARENSRGVFETYASRAKDKIIFNNDNDEKRRTFETCQLKAKRICNPIIEWKDNEIWDYINSEKIRTNPLYSCGNSRVGCIGCPMAGTAGRWSQFARYPRFKDMYIRAFDRLVKTRKEKGLPTTWETGEEVFHWWMEDGVLPGQYELDLNGGDTFAEE